MIFSFIEENNKQSTDEFRRLLLALDKSADTFIEASINEEDATLARRQYSIAAHNLASFVSLRRQSIMRVWEMPRWYPKSLNEDGEPVNDTKTTADKIKKFLGS